MWCIFPITISHNLHKVTSVNFSAIWQNSYSLSMPIRNAANCLRHNPRTHINWRLTKPFSKRAADLLLCHTKTRFVYWTIKSVNFTRKFHFFCFTLTKPFLIPVKTRFPSLSAYRIGSQRFTARSFKSFALSVRCPPTVLLMTLASVNSCTFPDKYLYLY